MLIEPLVISLLESGKTRQEISEMTGIPYQNICETIVAKKGSGYLSAVKLPPPRPITPYPELKASSQKERRYLYRKIQRAKSEGMTLLEFQSLSSIKEKNVIASYWELPINHDFPGTKKLPKKEKGKGQMTQTETVINLLEAGKTRNQISEETGFKYRNVCAIITMAKGTGYMIKTQDIRKRNPSSLYEDLSPQSQEKRKKLFRRIQRAKQQNIPLPEFQEAHLSDGKNLIATYWTLPSDYQFPDEEGTQPNPQRQLPLPPVEKVATIEEKTLVLIKEIIEKTKAIFNLNSDPQVYLHAGHIHTNATGILERVTSDQKTSHKEIVRTYLNHESISKI